MEEAATADIEATRAFPSEFKKITENSNFPPDLVFNLDETALYWKKLPSRTHISREEKLGAWLQGIQEPT